MRVDEKPVVVEQKFAVPIDSLWTAITELEHMHRWFFAEIPAFKPKVGFETRFTVKSDNRNFVHIWRITDVNPGQRIEYSWKYEGFSGDSSVVFELFNETQGSRLRLSHIVHQDFPDDILEFTRESCLAGWKFFITQNLTKYLQR